MTVFSSRTERRSPAALIRGRADMDRPGCWVHCPAAGAVMNTASEPDPLRRARPGRAGGSNRSSPRKVLRNIPLYGSPEIWYKEGAEAQTPPRASGEGGGQRQYPVRSGPSGRKRPYAARRGFVQGGGGGGRARRSRRRGAYFRGLGGVWVGIIELRAMIARGSCQGNPWSCPSSPDNSRERGAGRWNSTCISTWGNTGNNRLIRHAGVHRPVKAAASRSGMYRLMNRRGRRPRPARS